MAVLNLPDGGEPDTVTRAWERGASFYVPVALLLPWVFLLMGVGAKNQEILRAIRMVESSGQLSPPDGDGGDAIGPYQIHEIYWQDAVAADPDLKWGTYEDCRGLDYAEAVVRAYMLQWVSQAWRSGNAEVIARTHNGGPMGAARPTTEGYWEKVRAQLQ